MVLRYDHSSLVIRISQLHYVILYTQNILMYVNHVGVSVSKAELYRFFPDIARTLCKVYNGNTELVTIGLQDFILGWSLFTKSDEHLMQVHHAGGHLECVYVQICLWNKVLDIILVVRLPIPFYRVSYRFCVF